MKATIIKTSDGKIYVFKGTVTPRLDEYPPVDEEGNEALDYIHPYDRVGSRLYLYLEGQDYFEKINRGLTVPAELPDYFYL